MSLAAFLFLLVPLNIQANELKLGELLTLDTVTQVSEINKNPEKYLGERVLIEGLVINVCAKRGCWVDIALRVLGRSSTKPWTGDDGILSCTEISAISVQGSL